MVDPAQLLVGLNDAQLAAVRSPAKVLRILAGAGSGKTRVLTHRIAYRALCDDVDPRRVLAVTFTRKAAAELRHRLNRFGLSVPITAGTFHAIAYAQLRQRWQERGITPPQLLDRKVGFVARLTGRHTNPTLPLDLVTEIEWAKARRITPADYPAAAAGAGRRPPLEPAAVAVMYSRYEEEKRARRLVDFDDLLRLAARDLRADPDYAAARRWQFRHLFVDEFQDVNPLQFDLLEQWHGGEQAGIERDLCVVGDPNQAIYGWNGADPSLLERLDHHLVGCETVELSDNYRSSPQILGVANTVLSSTIGPGRPPAHPLHLRPHRGDGPTPTITACPDEVAEARLIARRVRDAHAPGRPWSDHGVLVRTNAQLAVLDEAFGAMGIPTRTRGGARLLDQPEVRAAIGQLQRDQGLLAERLDELQTELDSPTEDPAPIDEERAANLAEVVRLGREYLALDAAGTGQGFAQWLRATLRSDDGTRSDDAVDLTTFHAAKGLEWSVVHLAGLEDGLVPVHAASTEEALAEERRLLYVAITRARSVLHCTYAERRSFGDRSLQRRPSPFLEAIELAVEMLSQGADVIDLRSAVETQRTELRSRDRGRRGMPTSVDSLDGAGRQIFEQLRSWRLNQARAAAVPAYVIFNDATLEAIAQARPRSVSELRDLPGIGAVKAERFGTQVLRIVAEVTGPADPPARRATPGTARGRRR